VKSYKREKTACLASKQRLFEKIPLPFYSVARSGVEPKSPSIAQLIVQTQIIHPSKSIICVQLFAFDRHKLTDCFALCNKVFMRCL
jgi:hypothetical protein